MQKTKLTISSLLLIGLIFWVIAVWLRQEPDTFDVVELADTTTQPAKPVVGYTTTNTLIHVTEVLLNKSGAFICQNELYSSIIKVV